jgi:hypothetical protein
MIPVFILAHLGIVFLGDDIGEEIMRESEAELLKQPFLPSAALRLDTVANS